jgi:hypothetical protein
MLHEQFEQQNVAKSIENERFELKNAAVIAETATSSSNRFHQDAAISMGNKRFQFQNVAKSCNGSFQLQNAANRKETRQNKQIKKSHSGKGK